MANQEQYKSVIDPYYLSGDFLNASSGWKDAEFKVRALHHLLRKYRNEFDLALNRIADVGCGTGATTLLLAELFGDFGERFTVDGYDIHPQLTVGDVKHNVAFYQKDFCAQSQEEPYDLAVLFDVIEHVPDPIGFLKSVSINARLIALHIPLDDNWFGWMRTIPRRNLTHPGHLIVLDIAASLNLLAYAGLRVQDFSITPAFRAPSGRSTLAQRILYPFREMLYRISPYVLQRSLGGVSVMVIAQSPQGLQNRKNATA